MRNIVNITFYGSLVISFIIFLLPAGITMGVYSPNALGWFWLAVLIPATVVTLIWACVLDVKEKNKKALTTKVLIFLTVVLVSVGYWFYQAGQVESMG